MGRHSNPDDDADGEVDAASGATSASAPAVDPAAGPAPDPAAAPPGRPTPRGRHSAPDEDDSAGAVAAPKAPKPDKPPKPAKAEKPPKPEKRPAPASTPARPVERKPSETAADLRMLREDSALRSRVIAAIVVPFVLFVVVLLLAGRLDTWAVWIWIPLILSAVLAGSFLDVAHRRAKPETERDPEPEADKTDGGTS